MNIVIPLAGVGRRFQECGYNRPKPLVRALGKEIIFWTLDSLRLLPDDKIFIAYNELLDRHDFRRIITLKRPDIEMVAVPDTRGASETVKLCVDHFKINDRLVVLDGDTWYEDDILSLVRGAGNLIAYFDSPTPDPIYSYIVTEEDKIIQIKEKEKISDKANSGCYVFGDAGRFSSIVDQMDLNAPGEAYISRAIAKMIEQGDEFKAVKVSKFNVLGTPEQVIEFAANHENQPKRFCFDLDCTLVTLPKESGNYDSVDPIPETINYLRRLKSKGHTIIIYTARRMRTHSGNMGKVIADVGKTTINTLEKFGIPYDEIHFGKPYAHFYIDDLMVDPRSDMNKELGFYMEEVKPRHFNRVEKGKTFKKTSEDINRLRGEIHYHQWVNKNSPKEISQMFPRLLSNKETELETEFINGLNFSTMYANEILKESHLESLMDSLRRLHAIKENASVHNSYSNFSSKLLSRLALYDHKQLGISDEVVRNLVVDLDAVAGEGFEKVMIHGDPVFSNILLDRDGHVKMIDMRGSEGNELTVFGHPLYDWSKVYQSLCGYDEILLDKRVKGSYSRKLKNYFENKFETETIRKIKTITKSLLLSLIPLHDDSEKRARYASLALEIS